MASKRWWLRIVLYTSINLLIFGIILTPFSFTKLPSKTFDAIKNKLNRKKQCKRMPGDYIFKEDGAFLKTSELTIGKEIVPQKTRLADDKLRKQYSKGSDYISLIAQRKKMDKDNKGSKYKSSEEYKQLLKDIDDANPRKLFTNTEYGFEYLSEPKDKVQVEQNVVKKVGSLLELQKFQSIFIDETSSDRHKYLQVSKQQQEKDFEIMNEIKDQRDKKHPDSNYRTQKKYKNLVKDIEDAKLSIDFVNEQICTEEYKTLHKKDKVQS